ncbi:MULTISPECIES: FAD-dependent 5-carboxymethylaminomethyl-2-thiouridine(34) oxidoreductase MnmC [unclassified Duganella]|uniref:FAD-dependent 5-carboxymethylaminomethyl-2-thiouridine(34) oxidoreductase MnmC n=1 Tax=unclassified Duganella TaxID=2636909 RepID=UPI000E349A12|nr:MULTISPECIES: FAD-dependent 5-carboxymethylaminomethyl-2-thiouridine(34) oxidoreductase MnmC [unclassified Duganella]RFP10055.1 FAD-dependent oxidoreductase [Duganella sp. BJB475]RFP25640.1 FAD-dependent oxidoreductase [Duganella sp. BJB476]
MTRRVVLDTEFGHGERFMAEWRALPQQGVLHYLALTPQVPSIDTVADAQLRALWPLNVPGFHRILLDDGRVTLDLLVGALDAVLPQIAARVDAFHVDASFPAPLVPGLAKLAVLGATLHVHAADDAPNDAPNDVQDDALVWALTAAGFACRAVEGTQDVTAVYQSRKPQPEAPPAPVRRAIVIGAGLAGSSASHRLCANGWQVTLIERHAAPAQEASGNLAGIFMPLLSKDDNIPTRLSRAAYTFALREWRRLGGVGQAFEGASCGVLQLARDAEHATVQQDVVAAWDYPPEYVRWLEAGAASELLGGPTPHGGWLFELGGWVRPASLCEAMLEACGDRLQRMFAAEALDLRRVGGEWQVRASDGTLIAQAPTVVLANGASAINIAQAAELPLSRLRGQVTHLAVPDPVHDANDAHDARDAYGARDGHAPSPPLLPLVVCREAYVTPPANGIVCAGATYDNDDDTELRVSSQLENLTRLAEIVPGEAVAALAASAPLAGRVGFRCAAPDRLPLAGALPDYLSAGRLERLRDVPRHPGLHGLLGYASRGLIWAPLMAELLVSQLENVPPPLEAMLVDALDPGRFLLKQRRRSQ